MNSRAQAEIRATPQREPLDNRTELRKMICEVTASACREAFGSRMESLILTGSLARDEATFMEEDGATHLLGDAEFLVVFPKKSSLPSSFELGEAAHKVEESLASRHFRAHVELSAVQPSYFRKLPPHIFSLELRECGCVILGDGRFLKMIPPFTAADLDQEDAWRLLCNRLIETLEFAPHAPEASPESIYRLVKLYLDMATSLLIFKGRYASSYRERSDRLRELADADRGEFPFDLVEFSFIVQKATNVKLSGGSFEERSDVAREHAHQLWRWELMQLTEADAELSDAELFKAWIQQQPLRRSLRGWAYVVRARGWRKSIGQWPRWFKLALQASPRHWIYRAAAEAFFGQAQAGLNGSKLSSFLPVEYPHAEDEKNVSSLERAIVWNYLQFVKGTRA